MRVCLGAEEGGVNETRQGMPILINVLKCPDNKIIWPSFEQQIYDWFNMHK